MNKTIPIITLLWIFILQLKGESFTQVFQFSDPSEWNCSEEAYEIKGSIQNFQEDRIWLFLKDRYGNFYLQIPSVEFISSTKWEHLNVRYSDKNIAYIWAVLVDQKGNKKIQNWIKKGRFKDIQLEDLQSLSGYKKLAVSEVAEPCGIATCEHRIKPDGASVVLADFEKDNELKGFPLGGTLDDWVSGEDDYEIKWELIDWDEDSSIYGSYVLQTEFLPKSPQKTPEWRGGGPILRLGTEGSCLDISNFNYLEFDMRNNTGNKLEELKVKLESPDRNSTIELRLKDYGGKFDKGWSAVKIPLKAFSKMPVSAPLDWTKVDLKKVVNLTFIGAINHYIPNFQGKVIVDNIRLTK